MRKIFIKELTNLNNNKRNIYLVINDLGFNVIEPFKNKFPKRCFNAGVSEQSMMGMSAGIASEKCHTFVYSIANFSTFRCAEQIRNDVDYHKLPVTIVSVGSGVGYGNLGYSHHALQDYALMRSFPNMLILSPGNNVIVSASLFVSGNIDIQQNVSDGDIGRYQIGGVTVLRRFTSSEAQPNHIELGNPGYRVTASATSFNIDSALGITLDSNAGLVYFADSGVSSVLINTSQGYVSASGYITTGQHITSSGNISASGKLIGKIDGGSF